MNPGLCEAKGRKEAILLTFHSVVALVTLCAILGAARAAPVQGEANAAGPRLGEAAPDFALANIEGKRVRLKDYRDKKNILLVFYPALFRSGG